MKIKMARWWDRLGGRPVDHAASPRFIYRRRQHYDRDLMHTCHHSHLLVNLNQHRTCFRVILPPHPLHCYRDYTGRRAAMQDKNGAIVHFFRMSRRSGRRAVLQPQILPLFCPVLPCTPAQIPIN